VLFPGHARIVLTKQPGRVIDVPVPGTTADTQFLPVAGTDGTLWYLALGPAGWSVVGVTVAGRVIGPSPLSPFGPSTQPAAPVESRGVLYTLDRSANGQRQPELWTILPGTGAMIPLAGAASYPARSPTEKASFQYAEVLVDGPRVVFNNPGSL